jgi:hypothetical protein
MREPRRNTGASVRDRLLNIARERQRPFDLLLTRYCLTGYSTASARLRIDNLFFLKSRNR